MTIDGLFWMQFLVRLAGYLSSFNLCYVLPGKNNGGCKYGGIAEKPQNLTRHN